MVRTIPAIEAAFCNPERVTFAGSTIPAEMTGKSLIQEIELKGYNKVVQHV